ncbi:shikimate dehydrogenase (plasmid) [Rhizobium sp. WL3]|uniref:shikimate dehydrogenase family protein n=1 Tax=Rhizobium sp. WL3 TaxID=2603277 RepID=UPI0011C1EDCB|nr:shikimate dehydrogenase [Rhizobium sp. WL3]QEE43243.1 shikimate dehydrogenase [Rhizobium sp. WL3]
MFEWLTGATRLFAILGDPIAQVRSPEIVTSALQARGINGILLPVHVTPDAFDDVMAGLKRIENLDGLILTLPYKARGLGHVDSLGREAMAGGVINAVRRGLDGSWHGEMFDGLGCIAAMAAAGVSPAGKRVLLIGAGGAGAAIALAVAGKRPAHLRIAEIDDDRATALVKRIAAIESDLPVDLGPADPTGFDLVINASPMGMADCPESPLLRPVTASTTVFDVVAKPNETLLMASALANGAMAIGGAEMIRGQVNMIADFFAQAKLDDEKDWI